MPDLSTTFAGGIRSPNPFWLASAPPTNCGEQVMRAFDAGWGGAVWKTIGEPITNVSSRYSSVDWNGQRMMGLNNIELISDRPIETNLREIAEVKKRYPKHAVIASLMVESTREAWHEIVQRSEDAGCRWPGAELRLPAWHERARHGKRGGAGARVHRDDHRLGEGKGAHAGAGEADAQHHRHPADRTRGQARRAPTGSRPSTRSTPSPESIWIRSNRRPNVDGLSSHGGYCGPAVKPIALNMVHQIQNDEASRLPISGMGGIGTWRDAAEFILLGCGTVQVCTAAMHYGYRIVEDMIDGLQNWMTEKGFASIEDFRGLSAPKVTDWNHLNLNFKIVARIHEEKCIGCELCYIACWDGAHQCIHVDGAHATPPRLEAASRARIAVTPIPKLDRGRCVQRRAGAHSARG